MAVGTVAAIIKILAAVIPIVLKGFKKIFNPAKAAERRDKNRKDKADEIVHDENSDNLDDFIDDLPV